MGILSTDAKTAIANGNPIGQYWAILAPESASAEWYSEYSRRGVHGGWAYSGSIYETFDSTVIDAGTRTQAAYNVALRDLGDLDAGEYTITVDVSNGLFNNGTGGYFYNSDESYAADPQQCILNHQVHITLNNGTVEVLSDWYGRITKFNIESFIGADGTIAQTVGTITARPMCADTFEQKWRASDSWVTTVESGYDTPYAVYVPQAGISANWYRDNYHNYAGDWYHDYHFWVNLTAHLPRSGGDADYRFEASIKWYAYAPGSITICSTSKATSALTSSGSDVTVEIDLGTNYTLADGFPVVHDVRVYEDGDESVVSIPHVPEYTVDISGGGTNPPA